MNKDSLIIERLERIRSIHTQLDLELLLEPEQRAYLKSVCDRLTTYAAVCTVNHFDLDITMALLNERHEHYVGLNNKER